MQKSKGLDLIAISLNYPEINMVKYDGACKVIMFEIALKKMAIDESELLYKNIKKCLNLYYTLHKIKPKSVQLETKNLNELNFIRLFREVKTFNYEELKLFIGLVQHYGNDYLIKDDYQCESIARSFIKQDNIEFNSKETNYNKSFLVYRHQGQVVVSN